MAADPSPTYAFGPFRLEVGERRLLCEGRAVPLRTKVFDTLRLLAEHSGRLLTKHELMENIWPDTVVEENNLNHNISTLRRALGEQVTGQRYIETVPRVGYRFVADVTSSKGAAATIDPAPPAAPERSLRQEIRFCTASDGARIAYSAVGNGPPLVKAANWLNHLEYEWESPVWKHWIDEISRRSCVRPLRRAGMRAVGLARTGPVVRGMGARSRDGGGCAGPRALRPARHLAGRGRGRGLRRAASRASRPLDSRWRLRPRLAIPRRCRGDRSEDGAHQIDAARMGQEQSGVPPDLHDALRPRCRAGADGVVQRASTDLSLAGERGAADGRILAD